MDESLPQAKRNLLAHLPISAADAHPQKFDILARSLRPSLKSDPFHFVSNNPPLPSPHPTNREKTSQPDALPSPTLPAPKLRPASASALPQPHLCPPTSPNPNHPPCRRPASWPPSPTDTPQTRSAEPAADTHQSLGDSQSPQPMHHWRLLAILFGFVPHVCREYATHLVSR